MNKSENVKVNYFLGKSKVKQETNIQVTTKVEVWNMVKNHCFQKWIL